MCVCVCVGGCGCEGVSIDVERGLHNAQNKAGTTHMGCFQTPSSL